MLILPFSWPVVAFLCPHLHMQPPQVQVVSLEDVRRHCGEGNHRSICPFPSCAALRHLVYLWITAWWLRPDKRTDEPRGGGAILEDWQLLYFPSCQQSVSGVHWGRTCGVIRGKYKISGCQNQPCIWVQIVVLVYPLFNKVKMQQAEGTEALWSVLIIIIILTGFSTSCFPFVDCFINKMSTTDSVWLKTTSF